MLLEEIQSALPDRYRVQRELGRGGMATVYLATDVPESRDVAIKVLDSDLGHSIDAERFRREIDIAGKLTHPNILRAFDSGSANGVHYYVMPLMTGESLRELLDKQSQMPVDQAIQLLSEVCDALTYAHDQGIVHRDIKPENILLQDGHAVVADFGIARLVAEGGTRLTATGLSIGTATYMSPEQFSGDKVDGRSDLYSLASMAYEMLVGAVPFDGPNAMAIMARVAMQPVAPIRLVRPSVPEYVEEAILHALEKIPADRIQSVAEFKEAITTGKRTGTFTRTTRAYTPGFVPVVEPERRSRGGKRAVAAAAAILVTLALGVGGARLVMTPKVRGALAPGEADPKRISVLYFADGSPNGSLRFLADGLTESLIDQLDRVPTLDVISRDGVRPFRGMAFSSERVQKALKVGSIVRGEVDPTPKGAQVTVRLVDAMAGSDIARKSFDVDTANVVEAQEKLARQVSDFLRENLGLEVKLKESRGATKNSQAWTLVQRAEKRHKDADSLFAAAQGPAAEQVLAEVDAELQRAQAIDPSWPQPAILRAGVAYRIARAAKDRPDVARAAVDSGLVRVAEALKLDSRSPDALELRGELRYARFVEHLIPDGAQAKAQLDSAEQDLRAAVEINKTQAGAWVTLSRLAYNRQDMAYASRAALQAYESDVYLSDAREVLVRLFWTTHDTEVFPDAARWCATGHARFPTDPFFVKCRIWMLTTKGTTPDPDKAWRDLDSLKAITPATAWPAESREGQIIVAFVLAKAGLVDSARHVLVRARATSEIDPTRELMSREAIVRVALHDYDEAVRLLESYLQLNPEHRKGFSSNTGLWWKDPALQNNPRFKALIAGA